MRLLVLLAIVAVAAFLLGRATEPPPAAGAPEAHVYTGRLYDVLRVPGAATRCEIGMEAGSPSVSCSHVPYARARHDVVFDRDNILVFRLGHPDNPVWSARGRP